MHSKIISVFIPGQGNMKQKKSLLYISSLSIQISTVKDRQTIKRCHKCLMYNLGLISELLDYLPSQKISKTNVFKTSEVVKIVKLILLRGNKIFKLVEGQSPALSKRYKN